MPDLNYSNQEVTNEIKNTLRFWKEEVGVDGFKIDAVKHWIENGDQQENTAATLAWWRDLSVFQKSLDHGHMMVGEAWTSTQNIAPYSENVWIIASNLTFLMPLLMVLITKLILGLNQK